MLSALMAPIQPRSEVATSDLTSKPEMDPNQAKESPKTLTMDENKERGLRQRLLTPKMSLK